MNKKTKKKVKKKKKKAKVNEMNIFQGNYPHPLSIMKKKILIMNY